MADTSLEIRYPNAFARLKRDRANFQLDLVRRKYGKSIDQEANVQEGRVVASYKQLATKRKRQSSPDVTARQLADALGPAIKRLGIGRDEQAQLLTLGETVKGARRDAHRQQQAHLRHVTATSVISHRMEAREATTSADRMNNTDQLAERLMRQYADLQQWADRQTVHEQVTWKLKSEMAELGFCPHLSYSVKSIPADEGRHCANTPVSLADQMYAPQAPHLPEHPQCPPRHAEEQSVRDATRWGGQNNPMFGRTSHQSDTSFGKPNRYSSAPPTVPLPSSTPPQPLAIPPPFIDACPACAPSTYAHWECEVWMWISGYPTGTSSKFLPEIVAVLPAPAKIAGATYLEGTENSPGAGDVEALLITLDERFAKTDSEMEWSWLGRFTQFALESGGNMKGFWIRLTRLTTLLESLALEMSGGISSPNALRALKLSAHHLPTVLWAMGTKKNSHTVDKLMGIAVKMSETHRPNDTDPSEVYDAQPAPGASPHPPLSGDGEDATWRDNADQVPEFDWIGDDTGDVFLTRPNRPGRHATLQAHQYRRRKARLINLQGPQYSEWANGSKGEGKMMCWRRGSPGRFWKECPVPYDPNRAFGTKGKGKLTLTEWKCRDPPTSIATARR